MKYKIQVYNDNAIIHTEVTDEISPQEIEKVVKNIISIVGLEYKILYEEVKAR